MTEGGRKRTRALLVPIALLAFLAAGYLLHDPIAGLFGPAPTKPGHGAEAPQQYTCGMHPEIVQDEPGTCPICGMKLTPVKPQNKATKKKIVTGAGACAGRKILYYQAPMDPTYTSPEPGKSPMGMDLVPACEGDEEESASGITIDARIRQNMGIQTTEVETGKLTKRIRTVGHVDYDERRFSIINTKIDGWIERLYVDYTGQRVRRGQALLAIYSPKLTSTQQELLLAHRAYRASGARRDRILVEAAEQRLAYWDISRKQIDEIERTGKPLRHLTVYAPQSGVVVEKKAFRGMHVTSGMALFKVADLSRLWVYVHLYEMDVPFVKVGQRVVVDLPYHPGHQIEGRVDYIFPWMDQKTRDVKARLAFDNKDGHLKPEMYASVTIEADLAEEALLVDDSAVLRSGTRNVVFVDRGQGTFEPREIRLGRQVQGAYEVLDGLKAGDRVVINGQFMLDSESRLKEALGKYTAASEDRPPDAPPGGGQKKAPDAEAPDLLPKAEMPADPAAALSWLAQQDCTHTCPMPEHFYVCGRGPGVCPDCGMTLVPLSEMEEKFSGSDQTGADHAAH